MVEPILLAFALSGAAGLIYETVWLKQFEQILGTTAYASGTVLAVFMGGLAVGAAIGARIAPTRSRPARDYALVEIGIGLWALAMPLLFQAADLAYLQFAPALKNQPALTLLLRVLLSVALMGVPAILMGASFPLLLSSAHEETGKSLKVYNFNLIGAVLGCALAGFLFIPWLGLRNSSLVALGLNFAAAGLAFRAKPRAMPSGRAETEASLPLHIWVTAAASGIASMFLQISLVRSLVMVAGASVYAFSSMLVSFLAAMLVASVILKKFRPAQIPLLVLAGFSGLGLVIILPRLPYVSLSLFEMLSPYFPGGRGLIVSTGALLSLAAVFPAALVTSMAFPMALSEAEQQGAGDSRLGRLYAVNTLACVLGAVLASFFVLPSLGIQACLLLGTGLFFSAALSRRQSPGPLRAIFLGLAVMAPLFYLVEVPAWNQRAMAAGAHFAMRSGPSGGSPSKEFKARLEASDLLFYKEGILATVTVERSKKTGMMVLASNGKTEATTGADMKSQILVGQIPMLVYESRASAKKAARVALVGLASGVTAGSMQTHAFDTIDIFEIEPSMLQASRFFEPYNLSPFRDPRARFLPDDGRDQLRLNRDSFDVIVSEPSNPWMAGVSSLFTVENFRLSKAALREGGVLGQWLQIYELNKTDITLILRSFLEVFPEALLVQFPSTEDSRYFTTDLLLLGCKGPWNLEAARLEAAMQSGRSRADLARADIRSLSQLLVLFRLDSGGLAALAGKGELHVDDRHQLEYSAPMSLGVNSGIIEFSGEIQSGQANPLEIFDISQASRAQKQARYLALAREYDHKFMPDRSLYFRQLAGKTF